MSFTQNIMDGMRGIADLIMSPINAVWGIIKEIWDWSIETINSILGWLAGWIVWVYESLADTATYAFDIMYNLVVDEFLPMIQTVLDSINEQLTWLTSLAQMTGEFYTIANFFIPLQEFFIGCSGLLTVWVVCLIIKIILKAIPTIY